MEKLSTGRYLISTTATQVQCHKCLRPMWEAYLHGFLVRVEPERLNLEDEVRERMAGNRIFQTLRVGQQFELKLRTVADIRQGEAIALVEHSCERLGSWIVTDFYKRETTTDEGVPF